MTDRKYEVLRELARLKRYVTAGELAQELGLPNGGRVAASLDALSRAGWVCSPDGVTPRTYAINLAGESALEAERLRRETIPVVTDKGISLLSLWW